MKLKNTVLALTLLCIAGTSHATLIQNGNGTFTDTQNGYKWQNIGTFWGVDSSLMGALLLPNFHFASAAELATLQAHAPVIESNFVNDALAMGARPTPDGAEIIWGLYGDLTNWSYKQRDDLDGSPWGDGPGFSDPSFLDLGAFAVSIPEPETDALLLVGLGMLGFITRQQRQKAA